VNSTPVCTGTEVNKSAPGLNEAFAIDWLQLAKEHVLGDVLRLFSLRLSWLTTGDEKAYLEIARASRAENSNIRVVAELLLSQMSRNRLPPQP